MTDTVRRLGIMGGTFDPVHYGHLRIAELARERFALDQVVFVPNGRPAHKDNSTISDPEARLAMTERAIATNPFFACSRMEIDRAGPSYAIDTVRGFRKLFPFLETLSWIIGEDTVPQIATWHRAEQVVRECHFIAVTRPGYGDARLVNGQANEMPSYVSFLPAPGLAISATSLREDIRAGRSIRYLVPEPVEEYIRKQGLYLGG